MPKAPPAHTPLSRAEREALAGEILGASVSFPASPALRSPVAGTLID